MRYFFALLMLIVVSFAFGYSFTPYKMSEKQKIVNRLRKETAKKLQKKKNLVLAGTGGQMMYDIEMLAMSFNYYQEVDLENARELIVYAMNEYLADINNSEKIRPYLSTYPFTSKNIDITIFFYGPDRYKLPPEKIGLVASHHGVIEYYTRLDRDHPICEESYDEALSKVDVVHGKTQ